MLGFKAFEAAQDTLVGIELMHMIKKRQMRVEAGDEGRTAAELFYSLAASSLHRQGPLPLHDLLSKICDTTGLFARDGLYDALGMRVDSGATLATVWRPPRHRSPSATADGSGMAHPSLHRDRQHGRAPPRSKGGEPWCIDHEAHLLRSRCIVNSNSSKNRYSGTIPPS